MELIIKITCSIVIAACMTMLYVTYLPAFLIMAGGMVIEAIVFKVIPEIKRRKADKK